MTKETKHLDNLLNLIKTWIETESGPTHATLSNPDLQVLVSIRGYKKLILERTFPPKGNVIKSELSPVVAEEGKRAL